MRSLSLVVLMGLGLSVSAHAEGDFAKKHPRRAQVLNRDKNQVNKNNQAAANGQITDKQAQKLDKEDARIKRQEQRDARQDGGHITKQQQAQLNREENHVTDQRNNMEKRDAAANGSAPATPPATPPAASN